MSHFNNVDGEMTDVNPALLELTKDPNAWREQRRRAMKAKIFGHEATSASGGESSAQAYLLSEGSAGGVGPNAASNRDRDEANVLQQILSHKRRREERAAEAAEASAPPPPPAPQRELSMKEKLLQKYKRPE